MATPPDHLATADAATHPTPAPPPPAQPAAEPAAERRATWFELFCDLVFVAAVGQVTHRVGEHPTAASAAGAAALFVPVWWLWVLNAVRANRFDPDDTTHRLITMAGMAAVSGVAVFVGSVGHSTGADIGFVASYLAARAAIALAYAVAARSDALFRPILRSFAAGSAATAVLWTGAFAFPSGPARHALWAAAMAGELALPLLARRRVAAAPVDIDHLRERFGLFTIIVIGEAVLGFTSGLVGGTRAEATTASTGAAAFALCAGLWWTYFNAGLERPGAHDGIATQWRLRDTYVFGHLPAQLGVAVAASALGTAVAQPTGHLDNAAAACLLGGVALYLTATALIRAAFTGPRETAVLVRLTGAAATLALLGLAPHVPVPALLAAAAAVVAATAAAETPAHRRRARTGQQDHTA